MVKLPTTGAFAPLAVRDFRFLLTGFGVGQMLMPLQFITQILWVQHFAPVDVWLILVAFIATSRGLGAVTFGLYGGALADRYNRRALLLIIQALQIIGTIAIAALMYFSVGDVLGFSLFFLLTFLTAGLQSIDGPARLAIVPDVLDSAMIPAGMSLNQLVAQIAMPIAMSVTGLIIYHAGFAGAYILSALGHILAIVCLLGMRYDVAPRPINPAHRYGIREVYQDVTLGFRYARADSVLYWLILLLILMMSLGYPATASLGPTWVTTVVGVPIAQIGYVVMFWGFGSFLGAVAMMRLTSFANRGALVALGALMFSVGFVIFVFNPNPINAVTGNLFLGAGMTITMVSSTILIQHRASNEYRGRIMSLFQLNMAFAQLMTMPVAILGQWLGLAALFPILSAITLALVVVILASQRQVALARIDTAYRAP